MQSAHDVSMHFLPFSEQFFRQQLTASAWSTVLDGTRMMHRLGFQQQPFVVDWQQAPPASAHSRVRSILTAAAGLGCLNLRTKLQVRPLLACIVTHRRGNASIHPIT